MRGMFPHKFNTEENQDHVGKIPEASFFSPELMSEKKKDKFFKWYEENKINKWNLKEELIKYCCNDVMILGVCMMQFRTLMERITGLDPLTRCFTIASLAMESFHTHMLPHNFLGISPPKGYSGRHNSIEASAWLDALEQTRGMKIHREWRAGPYFVDGLYTTTGEMFKYNGCYYHGCEKCYSERDTMNTVSLESMAQSYHETKEKEQNLKDRGYKLVTFWTHDSKEVSQEARDLINDRNVYHQRLRDIGPINTRDAFFGGRTNNIQFMYECQPGEEMRYLDFTSLYPFLMKNHDFRIPIKSMSTFDNGRIKLEGKPGDGCYLLTKTKQDGVRTLGIPFSGIISLIKHIKAMVDFVEVFEYFNGPKPDWMNLLRSCCRLIKRKFSWSRSGTCFGSASRSILSSGSFFQ